MKTQTMYSANGEIYPYEDMGEAVRDVADNLLPNETLDEALPAMFTVYEADFTQEPASFYMPTDMIEQMDERAYDYLGEEDFGDGLFAKFDFNEEEVAAEIKAAIDAIFTKRNIQPTAWVGSAGNKEYLIEWRGVDDWNIAQ